MQTGGTKLQFGSDEKLWRLRAGFTMVTWHLSTTLKTSSYHGLSGWSSYNSMSSLISHSNLEMTTTWVQKQYIIHFYPFIVTFWRRFCSGKLPFPVWKTPFNKWDIQNKIRLEVTSGFFPHKYSFRRQPTQAHFYELNSRCKQKAFIGKHPKIRAPEPDLVTKTGLATGSLYFKRLRKVRRDKGLKSFTWHFWAHLLLLLLL